MGTSTPKYYSNEYYQGCLTADQCESLRLLLDETKEVPILKHTIANMARHNVVDLIREGEEYMKKNKTFDGFVNRYESVRNIGELRPEQTHGVAFMYYSGSCLIGDDVGLGKTVLSSALINIRRKQYLNKGKKFRALYVAEKASSAELREKLVKFTGNFVGLLESAVKTKLEKFFQCNPTGANYDLVVPHSALENAEFVAYCLKYPFDLVILDESSVIKNTKSTLHKNVKAVFMRTEYKVLLNATPFELTLRDVYNHLDLLDPTYLPTVTAFESDFTVKKWDKFKRRLVVSGYRSEETFKKLVSFRYLARTRKTLGAKYEDNNHTTVYVPMSKDQKALKTSMYSMLVDYPPRINPNLSFNGDTTPKVAVVQRLVDEIVGHDGQTVLIYCRFIEAQHGLKEILEDMGYRVALLNGQDTKKVEVRKSICSDFNAGNYDVLITNVLKGLDLNACDNCILYSIDPNPQKMVQFGGRITRDFDVIGKNAWLLVSLGKEAKNFNEVIAPRLKASVNFTTDSNSLILQAMLSSDNAVLADDVGDYE